MIGFLVKFAAAAALLSLAFIGYVTLVNAAGPDIKDLRTRDSITVPMGDGSHEATFGRNIHEQRGNGLWTLTDLTYQPEGAYFESGDDVFQVTAEESALIAVNADGQGIRWIMNTPSRVEPSAARKQDRAKAAYITQGLIWEHHNVDIGTKLTARVDRPRGVQTYSFRYGLINSGPLRKVGDNLVGDGFTIQPIYVFDAQGQRHGPYPYSVTLTRISFTIDDTSFPRSAFPYVIDPSVSFTTDLGTNDGSILQSGTTYPPDGDTETTLDLTSTTSIVAKSCATGPIYSNRVAVIAWDTSSLPEDATVTGVVLTVQVAAVTDSDERSLVVDWHSDVPPISGTDYTATGIGSGGIYDLDSLTGSGSRSMTLGIENHRVVTDGITSVRLSLSGAAPSCPSSNSIEMDMFEGSVAPALAVTYTSPLSLTVPTIGITGSTGSAPITGYGQVLDGFDTLVLVPYDIQTPGGTPIEIATDEYQFIFRQGSNYHQVVNPQATSDNTTKGYNKGLAAFYFPNDGGVTATGVVTYTIELDSINDTPNVSSTNIAWRSSADADLLADMTRIADILESDWDVDLIRDGRLTSDGQSYFTSVVPGLARMLPDFMALSVDRSNPTIATHGASQTAINEGFWDGTPAATAFTNAGASLGMTSLQFRTTISLLVALIIVVIGLKTKVPGWGCFMAAGVFLIIMVPLGMVPMALGLIIGFIGAVMGVWAWQFSRAQ